VCGCGDADDKEDCTGELVGGVCVWGGHHGMCQPHGCEGGCESLRFKRVFCAEPDSFQILTCDGTGNLIGNYYQDDSCSGEATSYPIPPFYTEQCIPNDEGRSTMLVCDPAGGPPVYRIHSDPNCSTTMFDYPIPTCQPQCDDDNDGKRLSASHATVTRCLRAPGGRGPCLRG
jgi:hypothetical protein